jgi:probable HAF family extracellular repeat protein
MPVYTYTTLDDPLGADGTEARGINDAGQVVGEFTDASNRESGFLYSNGTYTILLDPSGTAGHLCQRHQQRRSGRRILP